MLAVLEVASYELPPLVSTFMGFMVAGLAVACVSEKAGRKVRRCDQKRVDVRRTKVKQTVGMTSGRR